MTIRVRLALWYTAVLGITLVVFGLVVYVLMEYHLIQESDDSIISRGQHIASTIRVDGTTRVDGTIASPSLEHVTLPPIDAFESPGIYVQVIQPDGFVVARSDNLGGQQLPISAQDLVSVRRGNAAIFTADVGGQQVRMYAQPLMVEGKLVGIVQVGRNYSDAFDTIYQLRSWLLLAGTVSLLLAGTIGWAVASSALRPIAVMTNTARAIALSKGFSRRLEDTHSPDEMGQLGNTFNEMLASLEEAYNAQQRFIADASHELRTPLTAVLANLELLQRQGDALPPAERQELIAAAASEAGRMSRLVGELLSLARADAGQKLEMRPVELDRIMLEVYGQARMLADGVRVKVKDIDQVRALGDADRLRQLLLILVDNALRYTAVGGEVSLSLRQADGVVELVVADSGIGIAPEDLPYVFERFYRADKGRARGVPGTGLGLAIAKWIVEQHHGQIDVTSGIGEGSVFTVRLPLEEGQGLARNVAGEASQPDQG